MIVDRDNSNARGPNVEDENLIPAWAKPEKSESEVEQQTPEVFCSNEEPRRGLEPLRIDLIEDRFEYLSGKALVKEEKALQHYRHIPMKADANQMLTGLGTGQGTWGTSNLLLTKLTTVPSQHRNAGMVRSCRRFCRSCANWPRTRTGTCAQGWRGRWHASHRQRICRCCANWL